MARRFLVVVRRRWLFARGKYDDRGEALFPFHFRLDFLGSRALEIVVDLREGRRAIFSVIAGKME